MASIILQNILFIKMIKYTWTYVNIKYVEYLRKNYFLQ